jgi:glycosyltransferase involved in cell wall biosynthesis
MPTPQLAIVVTSYQMPGHLWRCLDSILRQRTQRRLEIIVADDGSRDETADVVAEFASRACFPVRFVTHEHAGFQAARSRNDGVRQATAPHLLFVDGDCVLPPHHVEAHLSAYRPGTVTSGYCVRLTEEASRAVTLESIERGDFEHLASADELHKLAAMHRKAWWYNLIGHPSKPALRSTDFSIARTDYERVNGFDQRYCGWGCEDDDLGRRLKVAGVRLVSVLDRTRVYHLWHPPAPSKTAQWRDGANVAYFQRPMRLTRCLAGLAARTNRDLTVRLAGEPHDGSALARLICHHGWQIECDRNRRADLELLPWPGHGRFRGQGDVRVIAMLDDAVRVPWSGRRAHLVLSLSAATGRPDQIRLRLADTEGMWQALLAGPDRCAGPNALRQIQVVDPSVARPVGTTALLPRSLTISST